MSLASTAHKGHEFERDNTALAKGKNVYWDIVPSPYSAPK